jgi:hypothetical protein
MKLRYDGKDHLYIEDLDKVAATINMVIKPICIKSMAERFCGHNLGIVAIWPSKRACLRWWRRKRSKKPFEPFLWR